MFLSAVPRLLQFGLDQLLSVCLLLPLLIQLLHQVLPIPVLLLTQFQLFNEDIFSINTFCFTTTVTDCCSLILWRTSDCDSVHGNCMWPYISPEATAPSGSQEVLARENWNCTFSLIQYQDYSYIYGFLLKPQIQHVTLNT